jgi:hypothetical protein
MLAENSTPPAHAGEEQSSPHVFAARSVHWANAAIGLLSAAKVITSIKDITDVPYDELKRLVAGLSVAVAGADAAGMTLHGAMRVATGTAQDAQLWSVINDRFSSGSISGLIQTNDWLRPGDHVYQAQTIHRHKLTEEDFASAGVAVIGGEA